MSFQETGFDVVLIDPTNEEEVMLAHYLRLPLVFNAWWTIHGKAYFAIAPSPLSYVPLPPSELTDYITFFNVFVYTMKMHLYKKTVGTLYCPAAILAKV